MIALPVYVGACVVLSVLISSIIWNLGTWYFGIPCSSSHTLIGAMIGASLGFTMYYGGSGVNWGKAEEIGLSLVISPLFGFGAAILLMYFLKNILKAKQLFHIPKGEDKPPLMIRGLLILTCTLVSFFHGSNDGQKGVGLFMLILIVFVPTSFAINHSVLDSRILESLTAIEQTLQKQLMANPDKKEISSLASIVKETKDEIFQKASSDPTKVFKFRKHIQTINKAVSYTHLTLPTIYSV